MKGRKIVCFVLGLMLISSDVFATTTIKVADVDSINNNSESTYKTSEEDLKSLVGGINIKSGKINFNNFTVSKNIKDKSIEESWLLENDILSEDINLSSDGFKVDTSPRGSSIVDSVTKSDFLMGLGKSFYGVEKSRIVSINTRKRNNYEMSSVDKNVRFDLTEGTYNVYTTPNVYEIYLTKLLSKGFINISDIKNLRFREEFESYGVNGKYPSWSNLLGPYNCYESSIENQLGYSVELSYNDGIKSKFISPDYFVDESLDNIDALKLLEKIMRVEEKDMTDTEAKIISYKYGVDYLMSVEEEDRRTIMFMIAKGILNFEDPNDFKNLYSPMGRDSFIKILYRVSNKNARLDFSKVQLTDNDNYWLSKGMYGSTLRVYNDVVSPVIEGSAKLIEPSEVASTDSSFLNRRKIVLKDKNNVGSDYEVERVYTPSTSFKYRNVLVKDLKAGADGFKEVISISTETPSSRNGWGAKTTVKYKINAPTASSAIAIVDNRTVMSDKNADVIGKIPTVVKVSSGSDSIYYMPKSALQEGLGDEEIVALDDKMLLNKKTGARAVFMTQHSLALIGNEVVDCGGEIVIDGPNGETYYNLNLIVRLMSKKYINDIIKTDLFTFNGLTTFNEKLQDICPIGNFNKIDNTYTYDFPGVREIPSNADSAKVDKSFFSMTHTNNTFSYLYKDISKSIGRSKDLYPVYLIVDWNYVLPDSASTLNKTILSNFQKYYDNANYPSVKEMSKFLSTKPTEETMVKWWESNLGMSNALCNFIYGSSSVRYFSSGYLAPSVTLLCRDKLTDSEQQDIMNKLPIEAEYRTKFVSDGNVISSVFGASDGVYGNLKASREYKYIEGFKYDAVGGVDFSDYVLDKCNVLYRSFGQHDTYEAEEKRLTLFGTGSHLELSSRKENTTDNGIHLKGVYKFKGKEYVATEETNVDNNLCVKLTAKEPVMGYIKTGPDCENYPPEWVSSSNKSVLDVVKEVTGVSKTSSGIVISSVVSNNVTGYPTALDGDYAGLEGLNYTFENKLLLGSGDEGLCVTVTDSTEKYAAHKNFKSIKFSKGDGGQNNDLLYDEDDAIDPAKTAVAYYPVINLVKFNWIAGEDNNIVERVGLSFTMRENLRNVGVASAVIDSVIDNAYNSSSQGGVKESATVVIGDRTFTKSKNRLISDPVVGFNLSLPLIGRAPNKVIQQSELSKLFDGCNVNIIKDGNVVDGRGLSDFIKAKDEKPDVRFDDPGDIDTKGKNILIERNGVLQILNNSSTTLYTDYSIIDGYVFSVIFEDEIKFRPIDYDKNNWTIMFTSSSGIDGYVGEVPYFTGTLGYVWYDDVFNNMIQSKYKEATDSNKLSDKIQAWFQAQFRYDIYGIIKMFFIILLMYLWVINFCIYIAMKFLPSMQTLLERINEPNGGGNKGFNVIKILSLGTQSIDREVGFIKWVGFEMMCSILLFIVWKYL